MVHRDNPHAREGEHTGPRPEAGQLAEERQREEAKKLLEAKKYHEALVRNTTVAVWWEEQGFGEELKQRFLLGARNDGEAIVPYWNRGTVQGLILRNLETDPDVEKPMYKLQKAERFVAGYWPLFDPGPLRDWSFLVGDYVDALALAALGYPAVAVGGPSISEHQMEELSRLPGRLYVLPEAHDAGTRAARAWTEDLYPRALLCPPDYGKEKNDA